MPICDNEEGATSAKNDTCCHHHGVYCPECRKSVCVCTVKDHIVYKNDSADERDEINKVFDIVAASVLCFSLLPLLLTINCFTSLTCVNVSQFSDSVFLNLHQYDCGNSGIEVVLLTSRTSLNNVVITSCTNSLIVVDKKTIRYYKINYAIVPDVVAPCDEKIKLNVNQPEGTVTVIALVCVILMLITTLLFCVACESTNIQVTDVSVVNSLNERSLLSKQPEYSSECINLGSKVDLISGKAGYLTSNILYNHCKSCMHR